MPPMGRMGFGPHSGRQPLTEEEKDTLKDYNGKELTLGVRPEDIIADGDLPVKVFSNENLGMNTLVHGHVAGIGAPGNKISAKLRGWTDYKDGDTVNMHFTRKHFFDKETTNAIRKGEK